MGGGVGQGLADVEVSENGDIRTKLGVRDLIGRLGAQLDDFQWRCGDSELQGYYVLGKRADGLKVKIERDGDTDVWQLGVYTHGIFPALESSERNQLKSDTTARVLQAIRQS